MRLSRLVFLPLAGLLLLAIGACERPLAGLKSSPPVAEATDLVEPPPEVARPVKTDLEKALDVERVNRIADRYYQTTLEYKPELAYFSSLEVTRHDGIHDNGPAARRAAELQSDEMLREMESIDPESLAGLPEWITYVYLSQALQADLALRVCRSEWWNVNHMGGWHSSYASLAQMQPVGTQELREQSLQRWGKLAGFINQEIQNLKAGLNAGYSAPKSVVRRVINQVDGLLAMELESSPFYSPASRDANDSFNYATGLVVSGQIYPALQRFRDYLAGDYLARARNELSVTANPDGLACYEAAIRAYTTLDRSGEEVFELGLATVEKNKARVIELGQAAYGLDEFHAVMKMAKADPDDRFASQQELLEFARQRVQSAEQEMPNWVAMMPEQAVAIVPFEAHEEGTGRSAHYRPPSAGRPAEYRIPLFEPQNQSCGNAEATAFHEAWPGHHLQVAVGQSIEDLHPVTQIVWFSGPGEGWARYAEGLAEEMGLYTTTAGPILRRAWPARGMVADPGIHLMGWTRQQAIDYMMEAGRFPASQGNEMVDRIAILPGQLTAYDSGGLEILALRKQAEEALGNDFDIREFHDRTLENGTIPLTALRTHIESWIDSHAGS